MSSRRKNSTRTRTLVAALLGLGLSGIAAGVANIGNPTAASSATIQATTTSVAASTTTAAAQSTSVPVTSSTGPAEHVAALVEPDPVLHPGAIDPRQTRATLCAATFRTKSVRPSRSYTQRLKVLEVGDGGPIMTKGLTYIVTGEHLPGTIGDYELDHVISLQLGGNATDPRNLWLEPWERKGERFAAPGTGAESKDVVENRLRREVCAGIITLAQAQHEIATDWMTAQ